MFVNCPSCRGLVATDPATDEPPERCPRCASRLRGPQAPPPPTAGDARSGVAAAIAEYVERADAAAADPADAPAAQPAISIATLLQAEPAQAELPSVAAQAEDETRAAIASAAEAPGEPAVARGREPTDEPGAEPLAGRAVDTTADPVDEPAPVPRAQRSRATGRAEPSFARRRTGADDTSGARRWPMAAAIIALTLLLGLQWMLADRARLAADPGWRPVVERACAALRCTLPPWHEPAAFTLLERDVRPHPSAPGALRITASFRNDAAWAQPWPEVVLTLSDIDGRPLGARAFTAAEYLGGEPPSALLGSGQGAVIRMDVVEPGPGAVGFAFDFR